MKIGDDSEHELAAGVSGPDLDKVPEVASQLRTGQVAVNGSRKANQALVDLIGRLASAKGVTPAQIALAWLLAQKPWIVPIPGTTKLHRLEENLGGADVTLTADDLDRIQQAFATVEVQGARHAAAMQKMINR